MNSIVTKTSFGKMKRYSWNDFDVVIEHLYFEKSGRFHQHQELETCYVVSGAGFVEWGNSRRFMRQGDQITIPGSVDHRMIPDADGQFEIIIWYHH